MPPAPETGVAAVQAGGRPPAPELQEQVRILAELVQLLATDLDARDQRHQEDLARLQAQLEAVRQQQAQWRLATERDVDALYVAQFGQPQKGKSP
jgi:hypothetical protein